MDKQQLRQNAITALIIIAVIAVGLFALNQFFAWQYKSALLQKPCDLCFSLNPNLTCSYKIVSDDMPNLNISSLQIPIK